MVGAQGHGEQRDCVLEASTAAACVWSVCSIMDATERHRPGLAR